MGQEIVAVVGLPGSGKTRLLKDYARRRYQTFDGINNANRHGVQLTEVISRIEQEVQRGTDVAFTDVELCRSDSETRRHVDARFGASIRWEYFRNDPYTSARNCLYRYFVEGKVNYSGQDVLRVLSYSKVYRPPRVDHQVIDAAAELRRESRVVGVAGQPGSGKSTLMTSLESLGFVPFDDMYHQRHGGEPEVLNRMRQRLCQDNSIAVSDIQFCQESIRRKLERELGIRVKWVCFECNTERCISNCRYRACTELAAEYAVNERNLAQELRWVEEFGRDYKAEGLIRPVVDAAASAT